MDLMRNGNVMYIKTNKMISGLTEKTDKEEICNCLINALLEKILVPTPDRKLYLMSAYEMMYDSDFEDTFLELEKDFLNNLCKKIGVNKDDKREFKIFVSHMINALTFAQNLFPQPTIIQHQEKRLRDFFKPMIGISRQLVFYVPVMLIVPRLYGVSWVYIGSFIIDSIITLWTLILVKKSLSYCKKTEIIWLNHLIALYKCLIKK